MSAATEVVNTAGAVTKLLDKNSPAVTANHLCATAIPKDMDPMSSPVAGTNRFSRWYIQGWDFFGEGYSSQCKLNFSFAYGATYNGGGAYIPSVSCWVTDVAIPEMYVPWPQHLDITFEADSPYTQDAGGGRIVAYLPFHIKMFESTPADNASNTWSYILHGDGTKEALS
jgi:hypothetical protein